MNPKWVRLTRTHPHTIHAPAHTPHTHHSSHGGPRSPCGPEALPGFSSHPSLGSPFLPRHPLPRSLEKPLNRSPPALTLSELGVSRDLWPGGHTACQPTLFVFSINPVGPPFLRPHSQTTPSTALSRPVPGSEPTGSHSPGRTLSPAPARTCCGPCHPVHWAPATLPPGHRQATFSASAQAIPSAWSTGPRMATQVVPRWPPLQPLSLPLSLHHQPAQGFADGAVVVGHPRGRWGAIHFVHSSDRSGR